LVDAFLKQARVRMALHVGWGACVEPHGSGHPYLPVLEALRSLCSGPGRDRVVEVMARYAPTWLVQMPGLVADSRLEELQRRAAGGTQARLLSELAAALEVLSAAAPVVVVFEDLQWADSATMELMAFLCRRRGPARCLILGTFRQSEVPRGHPLSRVVGELLAHGEGSSIELEGFDAASLDDYLAERFPEHAFRVDLAQSLLRSTGGKPLFVTAMLDELQTRGVISRRGGVWQITSDVDEVDGYKSRSVLRLMEAQVDRLDATERRIIEIGGAVGMTFTASLVAHAMEADPETVESLCETLAHQRKLLQHLGTETWPDGTVQSRYGFGLSLFREAALRRSPSACVRSWRGKIAARLAATTEGDAHEIATGTGSSWERRTAAATV
jgi:predicted ATPase